MRNEAKPPKSLSYNEVKKRLAERGGKGTKKYSQTDVEQVKRDIRP